jgi:hypothetical protein
MTGRDEPAADTTPEEREPPSVDPMKALLKRSLDVPVSKGRPSILREVQRRIRKRSRGKFFADGWSTSDARVSYLLVAIAMLLVLAIAYMGLGPIAIQ